MTLHLFTRSGLAALAAGALVYLSPRASHAEQFVLFDVTFDYTWEDAINATPSQSHYYVKEANGLNLDRPDDWVSPVDYRNGKVHIRIDVLEKPPGGQEQGWALCYVGNAGSYGCPYTDYYTEVGTYDREVDMTDFYNNNTIDWSQGIRQVDLVYTIDDSGQGHVHFFPELQNQTTPTKVRIAMVQVSEGSTFDPNGLPGRGGVGGAGGGGGSGGAAGGQSGGAGGASSGSGSGGTLSVSGSGGGPAGVPSGGMPGAAGAIAAAGAPGAGGAPATPGSGLQSSSAESGSCALGVRSNARDSWLLAAAVLLWGWRRRFRA